MASYVLGTGKPKGSNTSQLDCPVYSHTNLVGMGGQLTLYSCSFSHPDLACYVRISYISTFIILHLSISSKPYWCLNLKCRKPITHRSTPCWDRCRASSPVCFLEVSGCSSRFHNSLKYFLWRTFQGRNWEQMRRPLRASMVMSDLVQGKAWQDGGGRWRWGEHAVSQNVWEAAGSQQVYRWADWQQHHCKTQSNSLYRYHMWKKLFI